MAGGISTGSRRVQFVDDRRAAALIIATPAELGLGNASWLGQALSEADYAGRDVVIDMSATIYCDTTAVRELLATRDRVLAAGGRLTTAASSPGLLRFFEVLGVDKLLPVVGSLPDDTER